MTATAITTEYQSILEAIDFFKSKTSEERAEMRAINKEYCWHNRKCGVSPSELQDILNKRGFKVDYTSAVILCDGGLYNLELDEDNYGATEDEIIEVVNDLADAIFS